MNVEDRVDNLEKSYAVILKKLDDEARDIQTIKEAVSGLKAVGWPGRAASCAEHERRIGVLELAIKENHACAMAKLEQVRSKVLTYGGGLAVVVFLLSILAPFLLKHLLEK